MEFLNKQRKHTTQKFNPLQFKNKPNRREVFFKNYLQKACILARLIIVYSLLNHAIDKVPI